MGTHVLPQVFRKVLNRNDQIRVYGPVFQKFGMVRNKLKMSRKGARVQDIAPEFGFWHMGQLASDYKRHFGELPSESLIRSK